MGITPMKVGEGPDISELMAAIQVHKGTMAFWLAHILKQTQKSTAADRFTPDEDRVSQ